MVQYDVWKYLRIGTSGAVVFGVDLLRDWDRDLNIWEYGFGLFNYDIE